MKITTKRLVKACDNFAQQTETTEDRAVIIGYLLFLENALMEYGGEKIIEDYTFQDACANIKDDGETWQ